MFYKKTPNEVIDELDSRIEGLTSDEARERLLKNGKNVLNSKEKLSVIKLFLESFKDPLVIILLIAAAIQIAMGDAMESVIIFAVVILNAILGVVQTKKAESSLDSLKEMSVPEAKVIRDGEKVSVNSHDVVVGDIVSLEAGDFVPADGRIIESESLKIVEGMLTGESEPAEKHTEAIIEDVTIGDRRNMAFSTSMIVNGRGKMIVTATGMDTEIGKIAGMIENAEQGQTPLQIKIDKFGKKLGVIILVLSAIIFGIEVIRGYFNSGGVLETETVVSAFMFAVAIAVAAIPEALSSIVTIVLSIGTNKMVEKNAIIRRLPAVETLGSTSVICTDKTGTLTQNKMTVVDYYVYSDNEKEITTDFEKIKMDITSEKYESLKSTDFDRFTHQEKLALTGIMCNDSSVTEDGNEIGDPTEVAMINLAEYSGVDYKAIRTELQRESELPFDSDRKLMSTLHTFGNEKIMLIKGAPDVVISKSSMILKDNRPMPINDEIKEKLLDINEKFSQKALRVLAFGYRKINRDHLEMDDENEIIFIGYLAMIDPPRESVIHAISEAREAGIKTVMITGDHKITATAIAKDIGLYEEGDIALSGVELDQMSDEELYDKIEHISIYARVSPENKIRIVNTWQKKGYVTAMTGDGVNDAPALKQADIGIGMGSGTEVAKDAAAMVLVDDNFTSIVNAVEVGRTVYSNIKKSIEYLFSGNLGAIIAIVFAVTVNWSNPFTALQLLFINLVNDSLPAIALGFEGTEKGIMKKKPRSKDEGLLEGGTMKIILFRGIVIGIVTIIAQYIGLRISDEMGVAMAFTTLILSRTLQTFPARSSMNTIAELGVFSNKVVVGAVFICLCMFGVIMIPVVRPIFTIPAAFTFAKFMICVLLALAACAIMEIRKVFIKK